MKEPKAKKTGRPTSFTDVMAQSICKQVANGLCLKDICEQTDMPSRQTVYNWLNAHTTFLDMYARAREERADLIADEILAIADTEDDPNKARVRIDARKWWAAKVNPKKYGDRVQTENTHSFSLNELLTGIDGKTRGLPTGG